MDLKLGGVSGVPKVVFLEARLEVSFGVFKGLVMRKMQCASFASSEWYECFMCECKSMRSANFWICLEWHIACDCSRSSGRIFLVP